MAENTVEAAAPAARGFLNELVKQWRAQDLHGSWDAKSDRDLLEPYIMTREKRLGIVLQRYRADHRARYRRDGVATYEVASRRFWPSRTHRGPIDCIQQALARRASVWI